MTDQMQRVQAVYDHGIASYSGGGPTFGFTSTGSLAYGQTFQSGSVISSTAHLLSPLPTPRRVGCLTTSGVLLVVLGIFLGAAFFGAILPSENQPESFKVFFAFATGFWVIIGLMLLVSASKIIGGNARVSKQLPLVLSVWRCGWFCHRCGGAFYPYGTPYTVPCGVLLHPAAFCDAAWNAASGPGA